MTVLTRYFAREFLKIFVLCEVMFLCIFLMIDFIGKIDNFMEVQASMPAILGFFLYRMPFLAVQMVPAAVLIAVVVMFSILKKQNEITALKASGVNVFRLSSPILTLGAILCCLVFLFSELVVPYTSSRSEDIWNRVVQRRDQSRAYSRDHIWLRGQNSIYYIEHFDGGRMRMERPAFYFFDDSFKLDKEIHAQTALWDGSRWRASSGIVLEKEESGHYGLRRFGEMALPVKEPPGSFLIPAREPEEMGYWQLKRFAERIEADGYDATHYRVDMNLKLAFPFINILMVLIGIPIALGIRKGGAPVSVSIGVGVCFVYLVVLGLLRSLGLSGVMPPWLAAWLANLMFGLIGIYLMMRVPT